jgi:hypothetical protein
VQLLAGLYQLLAAERYGLKCSLSSGKYSGVLQMISVVYFSGSQAFLHGDPFLNPHYSQQFFLLKLIYTFSLLSTLFRTIGDRFLAGARDVSLFHGVHTSSGAHPAFLQLMPGAVSQEVKWLGGEAHHSSPSSTEVKNV